MEPAAPPTLVGDEQAAVLARAQGQREAGDLLAAEATCEEALRRWPDAASYRAIGTIYLWQSRIDEAVRSFEESLRLSPRDAATHKKLGQAFAAQGRLDEAVAACRRALELEPAYLGALTQLAALKRFSTSDDDDLAALESFAARPDLDDEQRRVLLFALVKAYEELGDYDRSFASMREANALARATLTYDAEAELRAIRRVQEVFDKDLLTGSQGSGSPSELPVLIVGMPRSGTTLVEQILASHPAVHAGGERSDLTELALVTSLMVDEQPPFPDSVKELAPEDFRSLGEGYVQRLHDLAPDAARVTDKTPRNFRFLGLLHLLLPNAKIIHCVRDPIDTCVSCYSLNLVAQPYTFNLNELGEYYRSYTKLMEHWRAVLPGDWVLDVRYEDLVADLEGGARRLVAHCGLDWDERCLQFHETKRPVLTASVAQVRRPVYTSSVARWRRYEQHLGELFDALGAPPPEQRKTDHEGW